MLKRPQSAKLYLSAGFKDRDIQQSEIENYELKKKSQSSLTNLKFHF